MRACCGDSGKVYGGRVVGVAGGEVPQANLEAFLLVCRAKLGME